MGPLRCFGEARWACVAVTIFCRGLVVAVTVLAVVSLLLLSSRRSGWGTEAFGRAFLARAGSADAHGGFL